jgi:hypothetical protein
MIVKDLIKKLKGVPQDYDVRIFYKLSMENLEDMTDDDIYFTNFWVDEVEVHGLGASGYETNGEVIIIGDQ